MLFFLAAAFLFLFILKMFFRSCFMLCLCNIVNIAQRTFEIVKKSRSSEHGDIINCNDKNVERTSTAHARVLRLPRCPETPLLARKGRG